MNKTDTLRCVKNKLKQQMVNKQENIEISKQAQDDSGYLFLVSINHNDHIDGVVKEWIAPLSCDIPIPHISGEMFHVEEGQRLAVLTTLPPTSEGVTLIKKYKRQESN